LRVGQAAAGQPPVAERVTWTTAAVSMSPVHGDRRRWRAPACGSVNGRSPARPPAG
jgi:hypothetical protein